MDFPVSRPDGLLYVQNLITERVRKSGRQKVSRILQTDSGSSCFILSNVCIFQLAEAAVAPRFGHLSPCIQPSRRSPCVAGSLHCRHSICEGGADSWWSKLQKRSRTNYECLGSAQRSELKWLCPWSLSGLGNSLGPRLSSSTRLHRLLPHSFYPATLLGSPVPI